MTMAGAAMDRIYYVRVECAPPMSARFDFIQISNGGWAGMLPGSERNVGDVIV